MSQLDFSSLISPAEVERGVESVWWNARVELELGIAWFGGLKKGIAWSFQFVLFWDQKRRKMRKKRTNREEREKECASVGSAFCSLFIQGDNEFVSPSYLISWVWVMPVRYVLARIIKDVLHYRLGWIGPDYNRTVLIENSNCALPLEIGTRRQWSLSTIFLIKQI